MDIEHQSYFHKMNSLFVCNISHGRPCSLKPKTQIDNSPYFHNIYKSPLFSQSVSISHHFSSMYVFLPDLCFLLLHILTMMHVCIILYMYWTPLILIISSL